VSTLRSLPDERYFINAYGTLRVRIVSLDRAARPYLVGTVELWPDEGESPEHALVSRVSRLFSRYARHVMELAGRSPSEFTLPADPKLLSYLIASVLQITVAQRQDLLATPGAAERLRAELAVLQRELPLLRLMVRGPKPPPAGKGPFSAN
jgi:Lon protease-like protein